MDWIKFKNGIKTELAGQLEEKFPLLEIHDGMGTELIAAIEQGLLLNALPISRVKILTGSWQIMGSICPRLKNIDAIKEIEFCPINLIFQRDQDPERILESFEHCKIEKLTLNVHLRNRGCKILRRMLNNTNIRRLQLELQLESKKYLKALKKNKTITELHLKITFDGASAVIFNILNLHSILKQNQALRSINLDFNIPLHSSKTVKLMKTLAQKKNIEKLNICVQDGIWRGDPLAQIINRNRNLARLVVRVTPYCPTDEDRQFININAMKAINRHPTVSRLFMNVGSAKLLQELEKNTRLTSIKIPEVASQEEVEVLRSLTSLRRLIFLPPNTRGGHIKYSQLALLFPPASSITTFESCRTDPIDQDFIDFLGTNTSLRRVNFNLSMNNKSITIVNERNPFIVINPSSPVQHTEFNRIKKLLMTFRTILFPSSGLFSMLPDEIKTMICYSRTRTKLSTKQTDAIINVATRRDDLKKTSDDNGEAIRGRLKNLWLAIKD